MRNTTKNIELPAFFQAKFLCISDFTQSKNYRTYAVAQNCLSERPQGAKNLPFWADFAHKNGSLNELSLIKGGSDNGKFVLTI
jgi:hypothetical protein